MAVSDITDVSDNWQNVFLDDWNAPGMVCSFAGFLLKEHDLTLFLCVSDEKSDWFLPFKVVILVKDSAVEKFLDWQFSSFSAVKLFLPYLLFLSVIKASWIKENSDQGN